MRSLIEDIVILRSRVKAARRFLLASSSVTPTYGLALYRRPRNWLLRLPEPYVYQRRKRRTALYGQGTAPMPPTPPVPSIVTLGPNSSQVVFASIDYQATVISQYANWS